MKIIGIGGLTRSGKDTLAELLIEQGWYGVSLGDIVRQAARRRHAGAPDPISVANMTETANWLRQKKGADFTVRQAVSRFEQAQKQKEYNGLVLYSVRAPVEVDFIHQKGGQVVWVQASDKVRYQRFIASRRQGEAEISMAKFQAQESLQWQPQPGLPAAAQMNAKYVKQQADFFITNNGADLEAFKTTVAKALKLA